MQTLLRKILRDLTRRKLRNGLTLLGIILGVAGVVAISTTTHAIVDAQRNTYSGSRQADLAAFTGDLPPSSASLIERVDNVQTVDTRSVVLTRFSSGESWENLRLVGLGDFAAMQLDIVELVDGRFPDRDEIAFDESARELSILAIGDVVAVRRSANEPLTYLTVSGFTRSPAVLGAGILNRATAYTHASTVQTMAGRAADNYLLVRVVDQQRASQTAGEIGTLLSKRGVATGPFDVRDPENFVGSQELNTLLLLLRIFAVLGAGLSAFLVANTLTAVMTEEAAQIGITKSLGGRLRHVLLPYLAYSGILGLFGALSGLALGTLGGRVLSGYLTRLTGLQEASFRIHADVVALAFLVGLLVTVAATLLPALRGARRDVAPLLRSPGVQSERRFGAVQRLTAPLGRLSSTAAIGARNAVRRPARTALTIVVVAVAVAAFIATQALSNSVSGTVDDLYALYGADAWISFRRPVDIGFQQELAESPDVLAVEPWTSASGNVGSVRTDLWGMPVGDTLYDYRLVDGTWFEATNPVSVVLTSNLAAALHASVGEQLTLDVGERRETVQVSGIVNDSSTYLGSTATGKLFLPVRDLHRLLGLGERADLFALRLRESDERSVDAALAAIEERFAAHAPVTLAAYADQESTQNAIGVLTALLRVMVVLVAVVGVAGITNTLLINITERRREYGVLRALGARTVHVVATLVTEGLAVATLGLLAGLTLGYPLARYLVRLTSAELFDLTFYLSTTTLAGAFIVALLVVIATSTMPGLIAARIRPVEVLRYE